MENKKGSVWWFFVIALGFTWFFELPHTLDARNIIEVPAHLLKLLGVLPPLGPLVAAFLLTFLEEGRRGVWYLAKSGWNLRFRKIWWVPTLLLLPAMEGLAVLLAKTVSGEPISEIQLISQPGTWVRAFMNLLYLAALEEYGWRGYALPRLQEKWNALVSSIILAAFWGPWHIQQWVAGGRNIPFPAFWFGIFMQSILLTWLYNNTRKSLLPVILFHAMMNAQVFPAWSGEASAKLFVLIWTLVPILIVVIWRPKKLLRD